MLWIDRIIIIGLLLAQPALLLWLAIRLQRHFDRLEELENEVYGEGRKQ